MCIPRGIHLYRHCFFLISPGCMFVTDISVLLVLLSRDRSPCSESHREDSISQSVYMAVAVVEFALGAFVLYL